MTSTAPRPARGRQVLLTGLAGYALVTIVAGVALVLGVGPGSSSAGSDTDPARVLAAAPVLAAQPGTTSGPVSGSGPASGSGQGGAAVPSARVARSAQLGEPFPPERLVLPGGASAPVRSSGLHPDGSLVIPDDPAVVGWWNGGALAGDALGGVVIAGHVDSARYGLGVMAELRTLRPGQVVELLSDTRRARYQVTARTSLPQAELAARTDAFRQDVAPRLVLITCGGAFDPARHRYQDNVVVYARPLA